ncbi:MAG: hypothetical protein HKP30_04930 [Myxococcales bacterium]|nr:hypothetical protein [Myxococcales bacterium]
MTARRIASIGLLALSLTLAGCGKYGPPEPYPPDYEPEAEEQDEEDRR